MRPVLLSLVFALTLAATEVPVSPPAYVPADETNARYAPHVAAGDGFLVTWEESNFGAWPGPVYARTYDANAVARQPAQVLVGGGRSPRAVWTGEAYLVVYALWFSRFGSAVDMPAIEAVLVRPDGTVIESSRMQLAVARFTGYVLGIVWNGTEAAALVEIRGERHLLRIGPDAHLISDTRVRQDAMSLLPEGDGYFLFDAPVLASHDGIRAALRMQPAGGVRVEWIDATGVVTKSFVLAEEGSYARSLVWDGNAWLATYLSGESVCVARFTGPDDITRDCSRRGFSAFVTVSNARTFLAWQGGRQIETDSGIASMRMAPQTSPSATIDRNGLLVAWIEGERVHYGGPGREERVVPGELMHATPRIAANAAGDALLVWREGARILALLLGRPLPIELGSGADPIVIARGSEWLVAFRSDHEIVTTIVNANGDPDGLQHFGSNAWQNEPRAVVTAAGYLLLWTEAENDAGGAESRVVLEPLDAQGRRISGGIRIAVERQTGSYSWPPAPWHRTPAIACAAELCLAAWSVDTAVYGMTLRHDATTVSEARQIAGPFTFVAPMLVHPRGSVFDVYEGGRILTVSSSGELLAERSWEAEYVVPGDVVTIGGRRFFVYQRAARVWLRDLATRVRAARH